MNEVDPNNWQRLLSAEPQITKGISKGLATYFESAPYDSLTLIESAYFTAQADANVLDRWPVMQVIDDKGTDIMTIAGEGYLTANQLKTYVFCRQCQNSPSTNTLVNIRLPDFVVKGEWNVLFALANNGALDHWTVAWITYRQILLNR